MEDRTVVEPQFPGPAADDATRVIAPGPAGGGYEATMQAVTLACPVCQTPNMPSETYCQDCGLLLSSAPADLEPLPDASEMPRLVDSGGREFHLNPGVNAVGREGGDILLLDPSVSRRHAQVTLENGHVVVEDLGSTNGTFVGGERVPAGERASAYDGDLLRFGSVQVTLQLPGGEARPAEAPAPAAAPVEAPAEAVDRGPAVAELVLADGQAFPLYPGTNTVGRRSSNDVVLPDSFASGKHAEILCEPDGTAKLVDAGSTNGTFYQGQRLSPGVPLELEEGMEVTMGKSRVTFRAVAAEEPAAEPAAEDGVDESSGALPAEEEPAEA